MKSLLAAAVLVASAAACRSAPPPAPVETTHAGPATIDTVSMFRHEVVGLATRDALLHGDLAGARRHANDLAGRTFLDGTLANAMVLAETRSAARTIAGACNLRDAARAMGELVRTCSECHARRTAPPRLQIESPPPRAPEPRVTMRRHAWAADQLWDGLVTNSELPWRAGASVLAEPTLAEELERAEGTSTEVAALAAEVERLGERASTTADVAGRSAIYGELVATCSDCHAKVR